MVDCVVESFARRIVGVSWDYDEGWEVRHVKDMMVAFVSQLVWS